MDCRTSSKQHGHPLLPRAIRKDLDLTAPTRSRREGLASSSKLGQGWTVEDKTVAILLKRNVENQIGDSHIRAYWSPFTVTQR